MTTPGGAVHTQDYLRLIGVSVIPPATSPFDPGYDPMTLESHIEQSGHLISILKLSMACWIIANEESTRRKVNAAKRHGVETTTGGGPFEIAVSEGHLPAYLDLCADLGVNRIECGQGFTDVDLNPKEIVRMARNRGLGVQFELGKKHHGPFAERTLSPWIDQGSRWLDAGVLQLVIEARESARGVGLFDSEGHLNIPFAEAFVREFGLKTVMFEAPTKASQFALLDHFGREVHLGNVRLEEVLRVEVYRRGLHSDSYAQPNLRPAGRLTHHRL